MPGPNQADKMLSRACCNPTKFLGIGRLGRLVSVGRARRLRPTNVPVIVEERSRYRPSYWSAPLLPVRTVAFTPVAVSQGRTNVEALSNALYAVSAVHRVYASEGHAS